MSRFGDFWRRSGHTAQLGAVTAILAALIAISPQLFEALSNSPEGLPAEQSEQRGDVVTDETRLPTLRSTQAIEPTAKIPLPATLLTSPRESPGVAPAAGAIQGLNQDSPSVTAVTETAVRENALNERSGVTPLAVLLLDANGKPDTLGDIVAGQLGGTTALFTPSFVNGGFYDRAVGGDTSILNELGLDQRAAAILLGNVRSSASTDERDSRLKIVTISCDAKLFLARDQFQFQGVAVTGKGVDFNEDRARREAMESLVNELVRNVQRFL